MGNRRVQRVAEELKIELGDLLLHHVQDPLIKFVTIIDVQVTNDLKHAKIYLTTLCDTDKKYLCLKGLNRAKKYLRHLLNERMRLKIIPMLHFHLDETWEKGQKIELILSDIKNEQVTEKS